MREQLRHTYLRVLHPLLTKTQLREVPYKRPQIVYALESLMGNSGIRDINPTTKRLVERCLSGEWCVQLHRSPSTERSGPQTGSPTRTLSTNSTDTEQSQAQSQLGITSVHASTHLDKHKTLKSSKSVEFRKNGATSQTQKSLRSPVEHIRPTNVSALSLTGVASATTPPSAVPISKRKSSVNSAHIDGIYADRNHSHSAAQSASSDIGFHHHHRTTQATSSSASISYPTSPVHQDPSVIVQSVPKQRRSAPPPPKRRKPPAVPVGRTNGGATISAIKSSAFTSPLKFAF